MATDSNATTSPTVPPVTQLAAPSHWRTVDFISDLHLQAAEPRTFEAWRSYMARTPADAIFILGDLFEVWVGDDAVTQGDAASFESQCVKVLEETAARADVFFMHGNRDFLVGPALAARAKFRMLDDPTALKFGNTSWLLTHGDALCLDDTEYMVFRSTVRSPEWQSAFLARPLHERQAIARGIRTQSESRKHGGNVTYADVDAAAAVQWLESAQSATMIHGHTHKPAEHALPGAKRRIVLSDWDAASTPQRLEVLRLTLGDSSTPDPVTVARLPLDG